MICQVINPSDAKCISCGILLRSALEVCGKLEYFICPHCNAPLAIKDNKLEGYVVPITIDDDDDDDEGSQHKVLSQHASNPLLTQGRFALVKTLDKSDTALADNIMGSPDLYEDELIEAYNWYNIRIRTRDLGRLNEEKWLTDEIIDVYHCFLKAANKDVHAFTTHFWKKIVNDKGDYTFAEVKRWSKALGKPLAEYRLILFPVHTPGHWSLIAVTFHNRRITYCDSLNNPGAGPMKKVSNYLQDDEKQYSGKAIQDQEQWNFESVQCPQQDNYFDCGVFVCCFSLCLTYGLPLSTFTQSDIPFFRRHLALSIDEGMLETFLKYPLFDGGEHSPRPIDVEWVRNSGPWGLRGPLRKRKGAAATPPEQIAAR